MRFRFPKVLSQGLATLLLMFHLSATLSAGSAAPAEKPPSPAELETLIGTLEDEAARTRLIAQLRVMARAMTQEQADDNAVISASAELLRDLSSRLAEMGAYFARSAALVNALPDAALRLQAMVRQPGEPGRWGRGAVSLLLVLAAAYLAYWLTTRLLSRIHRLLHDTRPAHWMERLPLLAGKLLLDLLPILAFAGIGYLVLTSMEPESAIRVIALAWINASLIVKTLLAFGDFLLAPSLPQLRLLPATDETAEYARIWLRRIGTTLVYGFMTLQAAAVLGLAAAAYELALNLLGLVLLAMLLILVLQNRATVAALIQGDAPRVETATDGAGVRVLRRRLGQIWHLLATAYLIMLYGVWILRLPDGFLFVLKGTVLSLMVILAARLILRLAAGLFEHGLRIDEELYRRYPGLQARVNRYFPALHRITNAIVYVMAALLLLESWGVGALDWATTGPGRVLGGTFARIVLIVSIALLAWELASGLIERLLATQDDAKPTEVVSARTKTLLTVGRNALLVVIGVVSTLMVLSELGVNIGPLLAGAGVLGLAVGFGAQRLVQDVITGIFILFQDLMSVGDVVKVGDKAGLVEALSIRSVRLRDVAGVVHTIPFSTIDTLSNLTREFSFYVFDLGVAYREDVDEVITLLHSIGEEMQADEILGPLMLAPIEVMGVDAFADSAVIIKGRLKTLPLKQWQVGRAFNRLVKKRFDSAGIEIPFPHRTIYFGEEKDGLAAAARGRVESGPLAGKRSPESDEGLASLASVATPDPAT